MKGQHNVLSFFSLCMFVCGFHEIVIADEWRINHYNCELYVKIIVLRFGMSSKYV